MSIAYLRKKLLDPASTQMLASFRDADLVAGFLEAVLDEADAPCEAEIHFGPGHHSVERCDRRGPHRVHRLDRGLGEPLYWTDEDARENGLVFSGPFDESPRYEDGEPAR